MKIDKEIEETMIVICEGKAILCKKYRQRDKRNKGIKGKRTLLLLLKLVYVDDEGESCCTGGRLLYKLCPVP